MSPPRSISMRLASQAVAAGDRGLDHGQAVLGRREQAAALLPRLVGHHQQHPVEAEGGPGVDGRGQVPDVDGVERPPQDTQPLSHSAIDRTRRGVGSSLVPQSWTVPGPRAAGAAVPRPSSPTGPTRARSTTSSSGWPAFPPLVFAGEVRQLTSSLAEVADGQGVPAPGRRLRRVLRLVLGRHHPGQAQGHPPDGGRPDLRVGRAGGEDGADRGAVRQAPVGGHRDGRRRGAARLPGPHGQRPGARRPRPGCPTRSGCWRPTTSPPPP